MTKPPLQPPKFEKEAHRIFSDKRKLDKRQVALERKMKDLGADFHSQMTLVSSHRSFKNVPQQAYSDLERFEGEVSDRLLESATSERSLCQVSVGN